MPKEEKKITFSGSIARRILFVCLALLVVPLCLYTYFLYEREVRIQYEEAVSAMHSLGATLARRVNQKVETCWKLVDFATPEIIEAFKIRKFPVPEGVKGRYAIVSKDQKFLIIGKVMSETEAYAIAQPLKDLISIPAPPFPIDVTFAPEKKGPFAVEYPIPETQLVLTLSTSPQLIANQEWDKTLYHLASLSILILFFGGTGVYFLARKLEKPYKTLQHTMDRVAQGAVHSRYVAQGWGFEANAIGLLFNETLDRLLENQELAETERIGRQRLAHELKVGRDLQSSLLPTEIPSTHGFSITPAYLPAKEVGGDFYDVLPLSSGKVLFAIGDVCGKGISACILSIGLRSTIRSFAEATDDLSQLARQANDIFLLDVEKNGYFATVWLGLCDGRRLQYASFGHPPPILKRGRELLELGTDHPSFGLAPFRSIEAGSVLLDPGDFLLLFTDGIIEAHNPEKKMYGLERLKGSIASAKKDLVKTILDDVHSFSNGAPQHDDIAVLCIQKI